MPGYSVHPDTGDVHLPFNEHATNEHSDLREFLVLLRRHVVLIVLVTLATAGATFALSVRMTKEYTASTTLLYSPSTTVTGTDSDPTRAIATFVGIGTSTTVLAPIATQYKLSIADLKRNVNVTGDTTSDLLHISAKSASPAEAAALANAVGLAMISSRLTQLKSLLQAQVTALQQQLQTFERSGAILLCRSDAIDALGE